MLKVKDIRNSFLSFFKERDHRILPSSSLIPKDDPTLLFTNAGMVQFKNVFLGQEKRGYNRAATVQRCVRAGGKHNDLEKVGYTARHHTFFEMLGNFSFGDYFKRDAIKFAWEFLTEKLKIPEERLWVTVYKDDDEAADIWLKEVSVSAERFSRLGEQENFWAMGDAGPCGPCSEIFYDHGENVPGGPPGSADNDLDRYVEIWNLVFMQYDRSTNGILKSLPKPSVDTGMGLERIAAVMQRVHSNYEIDLFQNLLRAAAQLTGEQDLENKSLRVIVDHIRSSSFLIADGVVPSNEGRGYVLRRIIRRAIRHGHKLGSSAIFFHNLVSTLVKEMGEAYPELINMQINIENALRNEEEQFARTLDNGMHILEQAIEELNGAVISGEIAFKLYDTYGFPLDLTADVARERNLTVDEAGFEEEMDKQRERGKLSWKSVDSAHVKLFEEFAKEAESTDFRGYDEDIVESSILVLSNDKKAVKVLSHNEKGAIITEKTTFYGESGGQVGDTGRIISPEGVFRVDDTKKFNNIIIHIGEVIEGALKVGDSIKTEIDSLRRNLIRANHTATHLLQAALRKTIGNHVQQSGSLVEPNRLRFDFSHFNPLTEMEISEIERIVNEKIWSSIPVKGEVMNIDEATSRGALAVFDEKYGEEVRVITIDDFSMELCGGTHVNNTGRIGVFKILKEASPGAGVRRIEAITLKGIFDRFVAQHRILSKLSKDLNVSEAELPKRIESLLENYNALQRDSKRTKSEGLSSQAESFISDAEEADGIKIITHFFDEIDAGELRNLSDIIRSKEQNSIVCFGSRLSGKALLLCAATKNAVNRGVDCGGIIKDIAPIIKGGGGGRRDMAQAGGTESKHLQKALKEAINAAKRMIAGQADILKN